MVVDISIAFVVGGGGGVAGDGGDGCSCSIGGCESLSMIQLLYLI